MPGIPKRITEEGLQRDLEYVIGGIDCHAVLASICPPRLGLRVLEPGCGSGKLGLWYALQGAEVTLVDIDREALGYAAELHRRVGRSLGITSTSVVFLRCSIQRLLSEWTGYFDFVFNEGVPHHWGYNPHDWRRQHSINEMARVTKPGGKVCVIGSNARCPETMKMAEMTAHTYPGMPPRQKPFTPEELIMRLQRAGLTDCNAMPVGDDWVHSRLLAGWGTKPL